MSFKTSVAIIAISVARWLTASLQKTGKARRNSVCL